MSSRWADACHSALYQPLQISIDANYASSSVTVRLLPSCRLRCLAVRIVVVVDTFFLQIAAFCVSALTGGTMFRAVVAHELGDASSGVEDVWMV